VTSHAAYGDFTTINWAWCMAVMIGILISINVSGIQAETVFGKTFRTILLNQIMLLYFYN